MSCTEYPNAVLRIYTFSSSFSRQVSLLSRCFRILPNEKYLVLLYQIICDISKGLYLKINYTGMQKKEKKP